nr:hypothetical protein CFP56_73180 [Quercus suber]
MRPLHPWLAMGTKISWATQRQRHIYADYQGCNDCKPHKIGFEMPEVWMYSYIAMVDVSSKTTQASQAARALLEHCHKVSSFHSCLPRTDCRMHWAKSSLHSIQGVMDVRRAQLPNHYNQIINHSLLQYRKPATCYARLVGCWYLRQSATVN